MISYFSPIPRASGTYRQHVGICMRRHYGITAEFSEYFYDIITNVLYSIDKLYLTLLKNLKLHHILIHGHTVLATKSIGPNRLY